MASFDVSYGAEAIITHNLGPHSSSHNLNMYHKSRKPDYILAYDKNK